MRSARAEHHQKWATTTTVRQPRSPSPRPRVAGCALSRLSRARSLSLRRLGYRRRRATPGLEFFVGPFAGDERVPGNPTASLPFLRETEHPNPKRLGYLTPTTTTTTTDFRTFCKNCRV